MQFKSKYKQNIKCKMNEKAIISILSKWKMDYNNKYA